MLSNKTNSVAANFSAVVSLPLTNRIPFRCEPLIFVDLLTGHLFLNNSFAHFRVFDALSGREVKPHIRLNVAHRHALAINERITEVVLRGTV
jgi:hypothetical protein